MPGTHNDASLKAISLRLLIISILATAVLGATAILIELPDGLLAVQIPILATSAILTGASICGLIHGACSSLGHRVLPTVGMIFTLLAAVTGMGFIWFVFDWECLGLWKLHWVSIIMSVGCTHLAILLLMKLHHTHQWAHAVASLLILGLASFLALLVVLEGGWVFGLASVQVIGVWSIATTAISLIIPVLWFLDRDKLNAEADLPNDC